MPPMTAADTRRSGLGPADVRAYAAGYGHPVNGGRLTDGRWEPRSFIRLSDFA